VVCALGGYFCLVYLYFFNVFVLVAYSIIIIVRWVDPAPLSSNS